MIREFQTADTGQVMGLWLAGNEDAHPFIPRELLGKFVLSPAIRLSAVKKHVMCRIDLLKPDFVWCSRFLYNNAASPHTYFFLPASPGCQCPQAVPVCTHPQKYDNRLS